MSTDPGTTANDIELLRRRLDRERRTRAEAESLAERGTRLLYERQLEISLLNDVTDAANAAHTFDTAIRITLDRICAYTSWPVGHAYLIAPNLPVRLVSAQLWSCSDATRYGAFLTASQARAFVPGEGLPGRVLADRTVVWIEELGSDANFPRRTVATAAGLHSAFAFPVLVGAEVVAVLEFFSQESAAVNPAWSKLVQQVGVQLGRVFERQRADHALRDSEARFRQVVENMGEALWMQDGADGRVLYVSPRYEQIWGLPSATLEASPSAWRESVHPEDRERIRQMPAPGTEETYRLKRSDGEVRWVRHRTHTVKAGASSGRLIAVVEDVTERKKLEEQFLRAQRVDAIGSLASGIAHDLNNLLTPILVAASLLKDNVGHEQSAQFINLIETGARRGAGVVKQLLLFSRGAGGALVPLSIPTLLDEVAHLVRETFPRDITLLEEKGAAIPIIMADATQIHQVLINLCVNARDAMPQGGRLTLAARTLQIKATDLHLHAEARLGPYIVMEVKDTGTGMSPEVRQKLFTPFFTTKGIGQGTGLGLSSVAGIVRGHGGFVTVDSEIGRGTAFKVYLPTPTAEVPAEVATTLEEPLLGNGELVLLADDEPEIRTAMRLLLERHRYRVLTAVDGRQALAIFFERQHEIALVLTDMMMPAMDGATFIRALRALAPKLKIIAASGIVHEAKRAELAAMGVTRLLAKPAPTAEVIKAVWDELNAKLAS